MKMKFYRCEICGNIIAAVKETEVPVTCCRVEMTEIIPDVIDASSEKHVPVFTQDGLNVHVRVGETEHPMTQDHRIEWIAVQTNKGNARKEIKAGDRPEACFALCHDEEITAVYAYCNLHGLWKSEKSDTGSNPSQRRYFYGRADT